MHASDVPPPGRPMMMELAVTDIPHQIDEPNFQNAAAIHDDAGRCGPGFGVQHQKSTWNFDKSETEHTQ